MGDIISPPPVKLFCGIIFNRDFDIDHIKSKLVEHWGPIEKCYEVMPFTYTDYYALEMGSNLLRTFWSFSALMERADLAIKKIQSNGIEDAVKIDSKRQCNIDPGYLTQSQLVLASTKDFYHRIYFGKGIYGELTLHYAHKKFNSFPWTYPDYQSEEYHKVFFDIRKSYQNQLKTWA